MMQDSAREAAYTPPPLSAYFASKEHIFQELAAMLSREFIAVIEQPVPAGHRVERAGDVPAVQRLADPLHEAADGRQTFVQ
jgi:AcrR family transcriptional regulator